MRFNAVKPNWEAGRASCEGGGACQPSAAPPAKVGVMVICDGNRWIQQVAMVLRGIKGVLVNTNGSLNSLLSNGWCTRKGASAEFSAYSTSLSMVTAQWLIDLGPTGSYDSVALLLSTLCCTQRRWYHGVVVQYSIYATRLILDSVSVVCTLLAGSQLDVCHQLDICTSWCILPL